MFFNKKSEKSDTIRAIPLGGQNGVGMNCWVYEYGKTRIMIDCGIALGIDMPVDRVIPDTTYLQGKKLDAVLLTHWHIDHTDALPSVWKDLGKPMVYGTPMTLLKLQTTIDSDYPKVGKLKTTTVPATGQRFKIGDFDIEFIHSTHHTPQSSMIALRTPTGTLLHTGDWTLNPNPGIEPVTNEEQLKKLNEDNFIAVIGDSTEVYRKSITHGEDVVGDTLLKYFKQAKKRIYVPLFSSTVGRMQTIYDIAKQSGREVCALGRSVETNIKIAKATGFLTNCDFIDIDQARGLADNQVVFMVTGCQGEPMAVMTRLLYDQYKGLTLHPDDMIIFSSSVIPGNEKGILPLYNKAVEKRVVLVTTANDDTVHAHGHAGYHEFVRFYTDLVKPHYLIPTHGDEMSKFLHAELAKKLGVKDALTVKNGDVIEFSAKNPPRIVEQMETHAVVIDGPFRVRFNDPIIRNREKMGIEGVIFISVPLSKGHFNGKPRVSSLGVFETQGGEMIEKDILQAMAQDLKKIAAKDIANTTLVSQIITTAVRNVLKNYFSKFRRPKIEIHFIG